MRGTFSVGKSGGVELALGGEGEPTRVLLVSGSGVSGLVVSQKGGVKVLAGAGVSEPPQINLYDAEGKPRVNLAVAPDGTPTMSLQTASGKGGGWSAPYVKGP